ncbi:putative ABC transport system permease protein [Vibrio ichthyoenteri ATCC 700023]|uniref:Putative ABC transport system permease protein n=1 Tax=Vibrio ichthyoenteri ATCC 700023 TaxID=870968 RepID=F9S3E3_9VIBR|nr:ABC transporter permease [Vibrio ichthyoenteri]EGU38167.1 putative ABC transport system permease protein [Vibrio ichthyoenteri ATCC 700023]
MTTVIDIPWAILALFFCTLLIPIVISRYLQLSIEKELLVSVGRMFVQLIFVGLYLEYLFQINSLIINLAWLLFMLLVGASSIVSKARLPKTKLLMPAGLGLLLGLMPMLVLVCAAVIRPTPTYNAQYLIPLAGMLLGNSLSGNIVALQNLFSSFEQRQAEYEGAIALGASPKYASLPFIREAMQKSLAPSLASMSTMGLVTLPGMMTGQILGGASPMIAIKYQLMIMVAIFVVLTISTTTTLSLAVRVCINANGRILAKPYNK